MNTNQARSDRAEMAAIYSKLNQKNRSVIGLAILALKAVDDGNTRKGRELAKGVVELHAGIGGRLLAHIGDTLRMKRNERRRAARHTAGRA